MLNFSFFDDDTLSGARDYDPTGALLRDVEIIINGNFQSISMGILGLPNNAAGIKEYLEGKGWVIDHIGHESASWFPGLSGFTYRIFAVVGTNYSDSQIQSSLRQDLSGFFNISGISTVSPPWVGNVGTVTVTPGTNEPPANYQPAPGAAVVQNPSSSGFLDSLGTGLGISTPIALIGGGLLLLILLRK